MDYNGDLGGIGTLCHEFGHVMGLPYLYDIEYGDVYKADLTPGEWDIMDGGSYNGGMHCPPNYNPWEKAFFGWVTPVNLGNTASNNILYANGTTDYNVYQVNTSGTYAGPTDSGERYYLENRQKTGWDQYIPSHGFVAWRVDYDAEAWEQNSPNASSTSGTPRFTVDAYGVSSWKKVSGKPVTDIQESNGNVSFKYKGGKSEPDPSWDGWSYYDDGTRVEGIGTNGGEFYWAIMFPANTQNKNKLTQVAVYETTQYNTQPITLEIYSGGSTPTYGTKIHTQTVNPAGRNGFHVITLSSPVTFDSSKNLWIVLKEFYDTYPASVSSNTGDPNGRWSSENGTDWFDLAEVNLNYTYMIRAYFEASSTPDEHDWTGWSYYDNGEPETAIGTNGELFWWGIMLPGYSSTDNQLTEVAVYEEADRNTSDITIDIYSGGSTPAYGSKIHTQTVSASGKDGWHIISLNKSVQYNYKKNLWIILSEGTDPYPAIACENTGSANGRWISLDNSEWKDVTSYEMDNTWMIRAYTSKTPEGIEEVPDGAEGIHKIIRNGQLFILREGKIYNVLGTKAH